MRIALPTRFSWRRERSFFYVNHPGRNRWQGGFLPEREPPWTTGLGTQDTLRPVAIGYDSVYPFLSESERKTISEGIFELGVKPILNDWVDEMQRIHSLDSMGHNWWSAIVFAGGMGVLAVAKDDPRATDWLRRFRRASTEWASYAGSKLETKPPSFDRKERFTKAWDTVVSPPGVISRSGWPGRTR